MGLALQDLSGYRAERNSNWLLSVFHGFSSSSPATLAETRRGERAGGGCVVQKLRGPIDQENPKPNDRTTFQNSARFGISKGW